MTILYLPNEYSQQRQREKKRWIYPVLLAMQAQYYRERGHSVYWGYYPHEKMEPDVKIIREPEDMNFLKLPAPDRLFTHAHDVKYQRNGNFKMGTGTYIQVANGCWHGKCTFCVEQNNRWQVRDIFKVHDELKDIKLLGFREVFDDSGTFPVGSWLEDFLNLPNPGVTFGCNMRMVDAPWRKMKHWGFRMVLFGLESANQRTLDRIHKGTMVADVKHIEAAAKAGLDCHVAVMFGYPWEDFDDAKRTLRCVQNMLKTGIAKTAQASFYTPHPGSGSSGREDQRSFVKRIYDVKFSAQFWINKIRSIQTKEDLRYFFRQIREGLFNG